MKCVLEVFLLLLFLNTCHGRKAEFRYTGLEMSNDTMAYETALGPMTNSVFTVKQDIDLKGCVCCLPPNVTLNFQGGIIKNGTLVGDNTKIESSGICFEGVRIQGTWDVPIISTAMFGDLDYDNSLKDVLALAAPKIRNKIVIEKGDYQVCALQTDPVCLRIYGNTEFILDGTIRIVPNDYRHYYILRVEGENIDITGNGTIVGDKHTHTGTTGEWGMGIDLLHAHNVTIGGLTVKDCWGDCIYVGGKSTNVTIVNCRLEHGRRQGISITSADGVTVRDCEITNVAGTAPEYAIDVEPNKKDLVDHVMIENVTVKDCKGGFMVYGLAKEARVGSMTIRNCKVEASRKCVISANKCDAFAVENCDISQTIGCRLVTCKNVGHVTIKENTFIYNKVQSELRELARQAMGREKTKPIIISGCEEVVMTGNKGL